MTNQKNAKQYVFPTKIQFFTNNDKYQGKNLIFYFFICDNSLNTFNNRIQK